MKPPFFITGLPRSRTAWLANLFTTDTTLCLHEPQNACSIEELVQRHAGVRLGISDAGLTFRFRELRERFPEARWVYVHRPPGEVLESLVRFVDPCVTRPMLGQMLARHAEAEAGINCDALKHVWFEQLGDREVIRQAWEWLLPEIPFNEARVAMLQGLNIQQEKRGRVGLAPALQTLREGGG